MELALLVLYVSHVTADSPLLMPVNKLHNNCTGGNAYQRVRAYEFSSFFALCSDMGFLFPKATQFPQER